MQALPLPPNQITYFPNFLFFTFSKLEESVRNITVHTWIGQVLTLCLLCFALGVCTFKPLAIELHGSRDTWLFHRGRPLTETTLLARP